MNDRPLNNFDATVLEQMAHIRAVGRKRLRNQNELDDFVQETVARVYANRAQLRDPAKLKQWIAGIARNTANEMNRAGFRKREEPLPEEDDLPDMRNPHDELERAERNDQIRQAMNRLNPIDRDLLQGRYMEEESYADLQERHGLSYSAVGFRLHRAKRQLRKLLTGMKVALALALANMKRTAFGGMLLMTNTTKIVLGVASVLILVLLGGYLWIEYGGSPDDSARGLTVEEQSPIVHAGGAADGTDSSAETEMETASGAAALQTSETPSNSGSGETAETATASTGEAAVADAPDDFSTELLEGIQELIDYADTLRAGSPELAPFADATLSSVKGIADLDAQLRRQGMELEERREKLLMKYLSNNFENAGQMMDSFVNTFASGPGLELLITMGMEQTEPPTKLSNLLMGDLTEEQLGAKIMQMPELREKMGEAMSEMTQRLEDFDLPELHEEP
ncbi:MAG: sigma-70 family RNA polymerase sigma factor [Candidatus Poribacteria bacterium]|nr:sigma-70 family RNA polymerase sigma factor [Candidatus Poribacteria bacterium]